MPAPKVAAALVVLLPLAGCGGEDTKPAAEQAGAEAEQAKCDSWQPCKFGQTAIYSDRVRGGEVKFELSVGPPVEFKPSNDARTPYGRKPQAVSVYFPITVKQLSEVKPSFLVTVRTAQQYSGLGGEIEDIGDESKIGDTTSTPDFSRLAVGKSATYRDAYTMATTDGITYEIEVDGQAGYTIKFER